MKSWEGNRLSAPRIDRVTRFVQKSFPGGAMGWGERLLMRWPPPCRSLLPNGVLWLIDS
jgi:hypothetical protein